MNFKDFILTIVDGVIDPLSFFFIVAIIVLFFYKSGLFLLNAEDKSVDKRNAMFFGFIGIAVVASIWGLVNLVIGVLLSTPNKVNLQNFNQAPSELLTDYSDTSRDADKLIEQTKSRIKQFEETRNKPIVQPKREEINPKDIIPSINKEQLKKDIDIPFPQQP